MINLTRMFYISRATKTGVDQYITGVLSAARRFNAMNAITGVLTFDGLHFTQVLEGEVPVVSALMEQISKDERHTDIRILLSRQIYVRDFAEWSMAYLYDTAMVDDVESLFAIERPQTNDVELFIEDISRKCLKEKR